MPAGGPDTSLPPAPQPAMRRRMLLRISTRRDVEIGLQTTIALTGALRGELLALFVEEEASLHALALPFQTLVSFTGGPAALPPAGVDAVLRREAQACRRLLAAAAEHARLDWSFRSLRGDALRLLRQESGQGDILILGLDRFGLSAAETLAAAPQLAPPGGGVLLLPSAAAAPWPRRSGGSPSGAVLTLGRASRTALPLLPLAQQLAQALAAPLLHQPVDPADSTAKLAGAFAGARLLLARLESPLFAEPELLRHLGGALRAPLLAIRTGEGG